jgi:peptidoglycan/LPS O-acetylase OafA/YrhL
MTKHNNFDLLRLFAALVVMLVHLQSNDHFPLVATATFYNGCLHNLNRLFPGVPVFFIISGFLITGSWLKHPERFVRGRVLRIYPAYLTCLVLTVILLLTCGLWQRLTLLQMGTWILAQATLITPLYTPAPLEAFGGIMVNGSLWTIPVECSLYSLTPLLVSACHRNWWIAMLCIVSAAVFYLDTQQQTRWSIFPMFWWFGMGMLAQLHWPRISRFVSGKALWWLGGYVGLFLATAHSHFLSPRGASILYGIVLVMVVLALAHTAPGLSRRILRNNDISYGIYLYHDPILHTLFAWRWIGLYPAIGGCMAVLLMACLSWHWIEKPCLRLKQLARMPAG